MHPPHYQLQMKLFSMFFECSRSLAGDPWYNAAKVKTGPPADIWEEHAGLCYCKCVFVFSLFTSGDCHLTVWSSWSSCQLTCLEGRSFETTGRQARSRAVIVQVMENQGSCPHQVFETQSCKGTEGTLPRGSCLSGYLK